MAFSVDQATLGTQQGGAPVTSFTLTTTHAVASGGLIVVGCGWFAGAGGTGTVSISGGGLTWNTAASNGTAANSDGVAVFWALAPSGLASSTVLTITDSNGAELNSPIAGAMSFLGAATSSPQDGTSSKSATAGNPWTGNAVTTTGSSDLVVGVSWGDGNTTTTTDTPTSPWTAGPLLSDSGTNGGVTALVYQMNVAASTYSPGGTWGGGVPTTTATVGVGFLAAAGGATTTVGYGVRARPRPRGPLFKGPFQMAAQQPIGTLAPSIQNFTQTFTAGLSFAGSLQKATSRILSAGLSFAGAIIAGIAMILTAGLSFAGSITKAVVRTLSAGLSFSGAIQKAVSRILSAGLSFAGALQKATSRILTAGLSFAGSIVETVGFGLTFVAGLSFNGAFQKTTVAPLTAGLSFAGAVSKATSRLLTASVSFAGGILKATSQGLSAGLSFAGSINEQVGFGLLFTAALGFTGAIQKAVAVPLVAGLSFSGTQQKALTRGLVIAGLGFAGGLTSAVSGGSSYPLFTTMWFAISGWLDG